MRLVLSHPISVPQLQKCTITAHLHSIDFHAEKPIKVTVSHFDEVNEPDGISSREDR